MRKTSLFLIATLLAAALCVTSCETYLSAGQLGEDSLTPPPFRPSDANATKTEVLVAASQADGQWYSDDYNRMVQAGLIHAWRKTDGGVTTEGHLAGSGWYGQANLTEHYDEQYIPSVSKPFDFYGGTVQAQEGLSVGNDRTFSFGIAFQGSVAYEDGAYKSFRAKAAQLSTSTEYLVVDRSPSNWSGMVGPDFSATFAINRDFLLRLGILWNLLIPDLESVGDEFNGKINDALTQFGIEIENRDICFAANLNYTGLNYGVGLSLGYILP